MGLPGKRAGAPWFWRALSCLAGQATHVAFELGHHKLQQHLRHNVWHPSRSEGRVADRLEVLFDGRYALVDVEPSTQNWELEVEMHDPGPNLGGKGFGEVRQGIRGTTRCRPSELGGRRGGGRGAAVPGTHL